MTSLEFFERGIVREIPSSWDEMTAEQVRFVMRTYDKCIRRGKSPLEFNIRVLYHFLGLKHNWHSVRWERLYPNLVEERNANIYILCEKCLGFLFAADDNDSIRLSFSTTNNALPVACPGWFRRKLIGPADLLQDLTFGEFRHAATALNAFFKSKKIDDLDECIAFLYRVRVKAPNRAGRHVAEINNATFARDVRRVARLPFWQKNLIMSWFAACINYLQTGIINIDGELIDTAQLFAKDEEPAATNFTWNDLLIQIAKEQTIGNIDRVDDEPLFTIISIMWHNLKERKRDEKAQKTH